MGANGTTYAKTGAHCQSCGLWLEAGVRRASQLVCTVEDGSPWSGRMRVNNGIKVKVSECQETLIRSRKGFILPSLIVCDICGTETKPRRKGQKRCMLPDTPEFKGLLSECQIEHHRHTSGNRTVKDDIDEAKAFVNKYQTINVKKRQCLRCGNMFKSEGAFNRICDRCTLANKAGTNKVHRVCESVCY